MQNGVATDTPLSPPDTGDICRVQLGPFNNTNQEVAAIDFAVRRHDGTWDNNNGNDYHIPVSRGRISVHPKQPALQDTLEITVHNSRTGGMLHWGVNAQDGKWRMPASIYRPAGSEPFGDEQSVETPLPPPDHKGRSTIQLGPFNRPEQVVRSLHMVVHWDDDWDTDSGRNYNVPVGLQMDASHVLEIREPGVDQCVTSVLPVAVESMPPAGKLRLWLDGTPLADLRRSPFRCTFDISGLSNGLHTLVAGIGEPDIKAMDAVRFLKAPPVTRQPVPQGTRPGATVSADGQITFALYAPGKHYVSVIGDFNDWQPNADLMRYDTNGIWWIRKPITNEIFEYQFLVNGSLRLADPYSTDVNWKDKTGRETWIPHMARSVFRRNPRPYPWQDSGFRRPPLDKLVIYELFIEDFCPGEGFTGVIARLDYIQDLGVNAIEPLPFTEFTGAVGWGYNPAFHFAPESTFGTPDELRRLVDEAHQRGIAVIMDAVFNHMCGSAPLHRLYDLEYDSSPYFHLFTGENWGMPDLDQQSPVFKQYVADTLTHWIREYHIDGFRYDATRWVGWEGYNDWGASWFAYAGRLADTGTYHIAEHLPTDPALMNQTEMNAGWHAHFRWRVRDLLVNAALSPGDFAYIMHPERAGFSNMHQRITYVESHDEERIMQELAEHGYPGSQAVARAITAAALCLTAPGIPMLYAGQEFGEATQKVVGPNPLHWELLNRPAGAQIHDALRKMIHLRTRNTALQNGKLQILRNDAEQDMAIYRRFLDEDNVVVLCNFSTERQEVKIPLPIGGKWKNLLAGTVHIVDTGTPFSAVIPPGGVIILESISEQHEQPHQ
jgi:1,4-alpha-glucan branching enzyme